MVLKVIRPRQGWWTEGTGAKLRPPSHARVSDLFSSLLPMPAHFRGLTKGWFFWRVGLVDVPPERRTRFPLERKTGEPPKLGLRKLGWQSPPEFRYPQQCLLDSSIFVYVAARSPTLPETSVDYLSFVVCIYVVRHVKHEPMYAYDLHDCFTATFSGASKLTNDHIHLNAALVARYCDTIAAIPHILRYFFREFSSSPNFRGFQSNNWGGCAHRLQ